MRTKVKRRRAAFVREYLSNGRNATRAYMAVWGCPYHSARSQAPRLFRICPFTVNLYLLLLKAENEKRRSALPPDLAEKVYPEKYCLTRHDQLELAHLEQEIGLPLVA